MASIHTNKKRNGIISLFTIPIRRVMLSDLVLLLATAYSWKTT